MSEEEKKAFEIFKKELSTQAFWTPDGEVCIDTLINIIIKLQAKIYKQAKEIEELRQNYDIAATENEELKVCYRQSKVEIENLREKRDKYYLLISKIREKLSHYEGLKKSEFQKHFEETGLPGNNFVDAVLAISRTSLLKELLEEG